MVNICIVFFSKVNQPYFRENEVLELSSEQDVKG